MLSKLYAENEKEVKRRSDRNMRRFQKITFLVSFAAVAARMALAVTDEPSLTYDAPFPGSDTGRIYYFVPKGLDLSKPAPLLVFMHGGNRPRHANRLMAPYCRARDEGPLA